MKIGFLRETHDQAVAAGIDAATGMHRSGLDDCLAVIFPTVTDWVHDKALGQEYNGKKLRIRPDYRSETLKMVVEFDGLNHYQSPEVMANDQRNTNIYRSLGYHVVRIPYFIQLTEEAIWKLFDTPLAHDMLVKFFETCPSTNQLFDPHIPSLGPGCKANPAYLCPAGINKMATDFIAFADQKKANFDALEAMDDEWLSGVTFLKTALSAPKHAT